MAMSIKGKAMIPQMDNKAIASVHAKCTHVFKNCQLAQIKSLIILARITS